MYPGVYVRKWDPERPGLQPFSGIGEVGVGGMVEANPVQTLWDS